MQNTCRYPRERDSFLQWQYCCCLVSVYSCMYILSPAATGRCHCYQSDDGEKRVYIIIECIYMDVDFFKP